MNLGFSGSRFGMTPEQQRTLIQLLREKNPKTFHHGQCVGSDEIAHVTVRAHLPETKIVIHPPTNTMLIASVSGDETREPKDYLKRNDEIVLESDECVVTPSTDMEVPRGGTWYVVRFCRAKNIPCTIIWLDGTTSQA